MDIQLIEKLKSQLGVAGERKGVEFCQIYDDEWPEIIRIILEQQDQANEWVSVEDRLPEPDLEECAEYYRIYMDGYGESRAMHGGDGIWHASYISIISKNVSHWMPITKPITP